MPNGKMACAALVALLCGTFLPGEAVAAGMTIDQAGAHASHTRDNRARAALACAECHAPVCAPSGSKNVVFGALAGPEATWNPGGRTCSNVYCHGTATSTIAWTYVYTPTPPTLAAECAMCHGYPPAPPHQQSTGCASCHPAVKADGTIDLADGSHLNGTLEATGCGGCHANPPATGAHVAHYGLPDGGGYGDLRTLQDRDPGATPTTAPGVYAFGCGNCHPMDPLRHKTGGVVLFEASAPAGSLKSKNAPTASFDPITQTCNGVYCHSTGQAAPAFKITPSWYSATKLGCAACHDNPPAYASGGAGSTTANSHLGLADDGYEFGHFLGMPGAWHTTKHGGNWGAGQDATPITCQTCHYDTTDPANTGPSGFYYLDTSGNYRMPGGDPGRISWGWQDGIQCVACHQAGNATAPTGTGKVLPLRHVNGVRDVVFDGRTTLPAIPWLPASPNTPTLPYWTTDPGLAGYWPPGVTWNGTTLSFGLGASTYDTTTKTCTNVACHVNEQQPVWGRPYQYYGNNSATCYTCHPM